MDNRVLEILFYLMDRLHETHGQMAALTEVSGDLKGLGYSDEEISSAYAYILDHLQAGGDRLYDDLGGSDGSVRILSDLERSRFEPDAYSFLVKASTVGLIDSRQLELILGRVGVLGQKPVTLGQLKMLVALVAFEDQQMPGSPSPFEEGSDFPHGIN
ncbi:MAG: DUF494 family protein [Candidatus Zixiibacteriota bacterium]|nr:MAG: DUF494 family protein [candidate division Zixibacteria bacterium]